MNEYILTQKSSGERIAIKAADSITISNAEKVKEELFSFLDKYEKIALNLESIEEFDTAGFQVLYSVKKEADKRSKVFKLVKHSSKVLKLMDIYGAFEFFGDKIRIPIKEKHKYSFAYGTKKRKSLSKKDTPIFSYPVELCSYVRKVLPIWKNHIIFSQKQTEDSVTDLTDLFHSLFDKIHKAVGLSSEASNELIKYTENDKTKDFSLKKFKEIEGILTKSQEIIKDDVAQLENDISNVIFYMQFSDRVGQILNQVVKNMDNLNEHLDDISSNVRTGKIDYNDWFNALKETYSTPEEHNIHAGKEVVTYEKSDVTFF